MNKISKKAVILLLACGLLAMLWATLEHRLTNPSLVRPSGHSFAPASRDTQPAAPAMGNENSTLGRLMTQVGEQPNNPDLLLELAGELLSRGSHKEAMTFLERAATMDVNNPDIPYLIGYIHQQEGNHEGAAAYLEESLRLKDRAPTRLSLGVIYRYFLKDDAKALANFEAGAALPEATDEEKAQLQAEIDKIKNGG